jgi:hypothetical protein
MRVLKALLRPSWSKLLLALILFGVYLSSYVQSYAFDQMGPKPRLYDLLSPLGLWPASVLLFFPVNVYVDALREIWPAVGTTMNHYVAGGIYSLLFAWVFLFAHQQGGVRIYRTGRLALPLIPVAVLFVLAHTWPESNALSGASLAVSSVLFTAAVAGLYLYFLFCVARGVGRSGWWNARRSRSRA